MIRAKEGLVIKERMESFNDLQVRRIFFQCGVIEEFDERREGWIHVGQPEHEHLFQHDQAMRNTRCFSLEVSIEIHFAAIDGDGREFVRKFPKGLIHFLSAELFIEPIQRLLASLADFFRSRYRPTT